MGLPPTTPSPHDPVLQGHTVPLGTRGGPLYALLVAPVECGLVCTCISGRACAAPGPGPQSDINETNSMRRASLRRAASIFCCTLSRWKAGSERVVVMMVVV